MRCGTRTGLALAALGAVAGLAACGAPASGADLHPDGPPKIEQVRLFEAGTASGAARKVFAFGSHPDASAADVHAVTRAQAGGNVLHVVLDELLRGDALEEIACRAVVDDDNFARVPAGITPDDIARCAVAADQLAARCPASNPRSVCLCARDGGCPVSDGITVPRGDPVGVLDIDADGAADSTRFVAGAVRLRCDDVDVAIDRDRSQWIPWGTQQLPAQRGFDALGPAVLVVPGALPAGATCGLAFAPDVVDASGNQICAPPGGDITAPCVPGDTSAVQFSVEPLGFSASVTDRGQSRTAAISIVASAPIDLNTLTGITVTEAPTTSYRQFALSLGPDGAEIRILWTAPDGLAADTRYTITIPMTVTDRYHRAAASAFTVSFTTGAS